MTNAELIALLHEARESVQLLANKLHNELDYDYSEEQEQLCSRIDAALVAHDTPHKVAWRNLDYKAIYVADCDGADLEVQLGAERWHWDVSRFGDCATLEEAQAAAVKAARGMR